ncbi:MAG: TRAP transporter small permease subunit [Rhodospirillales bacterium]|nr:TRAP transporter small permease subunit [Rhodospirillales bacterium]
MVAQLNPQNSDSKTNLRLWIERIEIISTWSGKLCAWLIVPMTGALVYEVFSRYGFDAPTMWAYDTTFMLYGSHFMLGAAFALAKGAHIRTDFLYRLWSDRVQATVDLTIYLFFFFPAFAIFFWVSAEFAAKSWEQSELITTSPWLPIVYPFKTVIPVTAALLMIQGVSESLKCVEAIKQGRWT